jgi:hypothetical protein
LASVDRLDLVQWIAEAQKREEQWQRRFFALHNELRRWHEYVEEKKRRDRNPKATKDCGCFDLEPIRGNQNSCGPAWKNIGIARSQEERRRAWVFLISGFFGGVPSGMVAFGIRHAGRRSEGIEEFLSPTSRSRFGLSRTRCEMEKQRPWIQGRRFDRK